MNGAPDRIWKHHNPVEMGLGCLSTRSCIFRRGLRDVRFQAFLLQRSDKPGLSPQGSRFCESRSTGQSSPAPCRGDVNHLLLRQRWRSCHPYGSVSDCKGALDKANEGESLLLRRGELTHMWTTGITSTNSDANGHSLRGEHDSALQQARECSCHDSHGQTESILEKYESRLNSKRMHLADDVIRTWFFVRDVDTDYQGLVNARRNIFAQRGMTP